jgi:hypothetical protein
MDGTCRDSSFFVSCPVRRIALDFRGRSRLHLRSLLLCRETASVRPFYLASVCDRGNSVPFLRCLVVFRVIKDITYSECGRMSYPVEKLIEQWLAEKQPEELPGKGKPLDLNEYFSWPEDQRMGLSLLKNSGCVPFEVEQLREIKRLSDEIEKCADDQVKIRLQRRLQEERVQLNLRIEQLRRRTNR